MSGASSVFSHLVHALRYSKNSTIRKNAALILGKMGNKKAVDVLIKALDDRVIAVRSNAAIALGMIGDKRAVKPLIERLRASSWQERLNAAVSLGWLADSNASSPLIELLYDDHVYVRRGAAFALGQIGDDETREMLFELLTHEKYPAPEAAVVLAYMGDLSGYHYLLEQDPYRIETGQSRVKEGRVQEGAGKTARKRKSSKVEESLRLGNVFYASGLNREAASEYRRGLSGKGKIQPQIHKALLNNLGNALCSLGQTENAVVLYLLALRIKSGDKGIQANLHRAEILSDIGELVVESLKQWLSSKEAAALEIPAGIARYFEKASSPLVEHFNLGWKSFYAMQAYSGEELFSTSAKVPTRFLEEQIPACRSVLSTDATFQRLHVLLLKLGEELLPKSKEKIVGRQDAFTYGYMAGLLQKIWHLSHLNFSDN